MKKVLKGGVEPGSRGLEPEPNLKSSKETASREKGVLPDWRFEKPTLEHRKTLSLQMLLVVEPGGTTAFVKQLAEGNWSNSTRGLFEMLRPPALVGQIPLGGPGQKYCPLLSGPTQAFSLETHMLLMKICWEAAGEAASTTAARSPPRRQAEDAAINRGSPIPESLGDGIRLLTAR
jgi:hypothetical protein